MGPLSIFDLGIILFYFVSLIAIGFYLKKFASQGFQDYAIGARKIPWWAMGFSGMEQWLDMAGTMIIVSFLYLLGPRGLYIEFRGGAVLGLPFIMLWVGKWLRRSEVVTPAEYMIFRFGDGFGGRFAQLAAAVAGILSTVGMMAYLIKAAGLFLSMFIPLEPFTCAFLLVIIATVYTMMSGFYGVVFTDVFQSIFVVTAVVIVSVMSFGKIGAHADFAGLAAQVTGQSNWTGALPGVGIDMPKGYEVYNNLVMFAFFYFISASIRGMGFRGDQKFFGARNERETGTMSFLIMWLMALRWPLMIGFAVLGIFLVADMYPNQEVLAQSAMLIKQHVPEITKPQWATCISNLIHHPEACSPELISGLKEVLGADWANRLYLLSYEGNINPERILPAVLLFVLGSGARGVVLVGLIAAAMSTFDSQINLTAGIMSRDIYQKYIRPKADDKELLAVAWFSVCLLVALSFVFSFGLKSINDIWGWIMMGLGTGLVVPIFLRFYWWRLNGSGFALATVLGGTAAMIYKAAGESLYEACPYLEFLKDERWLFCTFIVLGFIGSVAGSYLTKATDRKVLENYYRKTRPFGLWGPLKNIFSAEERVEIRKEHRNDLLALPFVLSMQVALFMGAMQLVLRSWGSFFVCMGIVLIGGAGTYFFWYRNLSPAGLDEKK